MTGGLTSRAGGVRSLRLAGVLTAIVLVLGALSAATAWAETSGSVENENAIVTASCTSVSVTYRNFPNAPNNVVTQTITIHGAVYSKTKFTFNGSSGTITMPIVVPPGPGVVDDHATWNTNGARGHFDLGVPLECPAAPDFSIVKRQKIEGSKTAFTTAPLSGTIGQTVEYEIVIKNTGNVPLVFTSFTDEHCGTLTGSPGATAIERGGSFTLHCSHVLTTAGQYENTATATAERSNGSGSPVTHSSNTVVVNVPPQPAFTISKLQELAGSNAGFTTNPLVGTTGQTVDYEIVLTNAGNVPLTFSEFTDNGCESVTGGPGGIEIAPGGSETYYCEHVLTTLPYTNTATVTGSPPAGDGSPVTHTSNPVEVVAEPGEEGKEEGENAVVTATCSYISVTYRGFPNQPNNTLTQTITVHGVVVSKTKFTFNGPTGTDYVSIVVPPGTGVADVHAIWSTNGFKGQFDIGVSLECPPVPDFSITKLQRVAGTNTSFTTSPLTAQAGQSIEYEIVVKNTGNVPLTFTNFIDEQCAPVTGGPGTTKVPLRGTSAYHCTRLLEAPGEYTNTATVTARRSTNNGPTVTHSSNTVVVEAS
jgi:hypothetical protein